MKKPLLIVGPTSSGKTSLSLWLASNPLFQGRVDILVVDSKQAYKEQDIVTGKDLPSDFRQETIQIQGTPVSIYTDGIIRIFGLDMVEPNQDWSLAQFLSYAQLVKECVEADNRILFIVGGTPLYTLSLFKAPKTSAVGPNQSLREELGACSVEELQQRLRRLDRRRFEHMNLSDQRNPRRLIRAIEIAVSKHMRDGWIPQKQVRSPLFVSIFSIGDVNWIGLLVDKETVEQRIEARVRERIVQGAIQEYTFLKDSFPDWKPEAKLALGYFDIERFVDGQVNKEELLSLWTKHEVQYAKRQMTWWKREKHIQWVDTSNSNFKEEVLQMAIGWYNEKARDEETYETIQS